MLENEEGFNKDAVELLSRKCEESNTFPKKSRELYTSYIGGNL